MFVLIWATLFFSLRSSNANTGASIRVSQHCSGEYCITLPEGEITAEAGLCVVIPCSFTNAYSFTPQNLVWYKCQPTKPRCSDSDVIFHTNKKNTKVQPEFSERVSLLEPDVNQKNCSIIINDLKESDSGSYQLRINGLGWYGRQDGFTYPYRATVSIKGVSQKPTLMIPPLTEGQQTALTCTAPGHCSGSEPEITWTWRRAGENSSHITGNITDFKTENLTAFTQEHSSTLTFTPSVEHHGTEVTCKVSFTGMTTEKTVTLSVNYVKAVTITGDTRVKEGETLNLTCNVESFPPSLIMWTKSPELNIQNGTKTNLQNDTLTELWQKNSKPYLQEGSEMASPSLIHLFIPNVTAKHSGLYICGAKYLNNTWNKDVDVKVIYIGEPGFTGETTVKEGDALNLTCSVESFPPAFITWNKLNFNTTLNNGPDLQSENGTATLIVPNVTTEDSGQYICTVKYLETTVTIQTEVIVTWFSKTLKTSGCEIKSELLTCVCISEGFPVPSIKWPLLENHTEYSVVTTVSNHTVTSTMILPAGCANISVECLSSNENGETKQSLITRKLQDDRLKNVFKTISWLKIIIAFLLGALLSAIICYLADKYHRKKQKSFGNLDETLEMVTNQEHSQIYDGQTVEDDQTQSQEGAEDATVGGGKTLDPGVPGLKSMLNDVEYASIDFSLLKRSRQATKKQETMETEYAVIKNKVREESEDKGEDESEMLEGEKQDKDAKGCVPEEEEGADTAVYSTVKDIMGEM